MHFTYLFLYYLLTVLAWAHTALYLVCVTQKPLAHSLQHWKKKVQGMGCTWTCARMYRLQSVATSLFTSHRKEATDNCSPVASLSENLQLDFKTLDSGKFSIRLWVHEYHTWINWAIQQSKSHLAGCHRWFFYQLGGQQTNPTPTTTHYFPIGVNCRGFRDPELWWIHPAPNDTTWSVPGCHREPCGNVGVCFAQTALKWLMVSPPKQHLTG